MIITTMITKSLKTLFYARKGLLRLVVPVWGNWGYGPYWYLGIPVKNLIFEGDVKILTLGISNWFVLSKSTCKCFP